jgi:hypothetical protein
MVRKKSTTIKSGLINSSFGNILYMNKWFKEFNNADEITGKYGPEADGSRSWDVGHRGAVAVWLGAAG